MSEHSLTREGMMANFSKRQQEIINTAIELIAEKGIQQLTIKNLSKRIGIAESAIYRHFSSKLDILLSILSLFHLNSEQMNQALAGTQSNPSQKLKMLLEGRFAHFAKNPTIATVIFSEELFRNDRRLSDRIYEMIKTNQELIISILKEGQRSGDFRNDFDPEEMAFMIMGGMRLIVTQWRFSEYQFDLQKKGQRFWQTIEILIKK